MKEKSEKRGKALSSNFLYTSAILPLRISVTFTVDLKPVLVKILLLLTNSMNSFLIQPLTVSRSAFAICACAFRPITLRSDDKMRWILPSNQVFKLGLWLSGLAYKSEDEDNEINSEFNSPSSALLMHMFKDCDCVTCL